MDNLDIKILSRLLNNCRESDRQIGIALGVSGGTVNARIRKMSAIERFTIKVEPPVFGYGVLYIVVSGQNIAEILKQTSLIGDPFFLVPCVGGITVCSLVIKDHKQKIELANTLMKDVRVLSIFEAASPGFNTNLTKTDLEILEYLMKDPRQKIEELSRHTSMSAKTVTRCLEKLQNSGGVQFTVIYDPTKIDNLIPHVILTEIDGKLEDVLDIMNKKFSNSFLQNPFIAENQIVLFMYSEDIFKMDDLTQKVINTSNVKSADLFIPKKILFFDSWLKDAINSAKKSPKLHLTINNKR